MLFKNISSFPFITYSTKSAFETPTLIDFAAPQHTLLWPLTTTGSKVKQCDCKWVGIDHCGHIRSHLYWHLIILWSQSRIFTLVWIIQVCFFPDQTGVITWLTNHIQNCVPNYVNNSANVLLSLISCNLRPQSCQSQYCLFDKQTWVSQNASIVLKRKLEIACPLHGLFRLS